MSQDLIHTLTGIKWKNKYTSKNKDYIFNSQHQNYLSGEDVTLKATQLFFLFLRIISIWESNFQNIL